MTVVTLDTLRDYAERQDAEFLARYFRRQLAQIPPDLHPNSGAYRDAITTAWGNTTVVAYKLGQRTTERRLGVRR